MARPRKFDESSALSAATEVFWRQGYQGATSANLAAACGIHEPSLFGAFGNKRSLFSRCLNHYGETHSKPALDRAMTCSSPLQSLILFLQALQHSVTTPNQPQGCFLTNSLAELNRLEPELREQVQTMHQGMLDQMQLWLEQAQAAGELPTTADPARLTAALAAHIYGWGMLANMDTTLVHSAAESCISWLQAVASTTTPVTRTLKRGKRTN
jgi:TetR/AcrR family transcriptional regulator, transcriptional repressor for nem operon